MYNDVADAAGKLSSDAAACKPWRCSTPCGGQQQQQQQPDHHQLSLTGLYSGVSLASQPMPPMTDYTAAGAVTGGLLDSKPAAIIAASMF